MTTTGKDVGAGKVAGAGRLLVGRIGGVAGSLALSQLITGLTYVLAARSITPASLGVIATCAAIGTIGSNVFDLGLTGFVLREVASHKMDMSRARAAVKAKRRLCIVLLATTLVASLVIAPTAVMGAVLGLIGLVMWEALTANSLMRAQEWFARAATAQLSGRVIGLVVLVVFLLLGATELALPAGLAVGYAAEALIDRGFLGRDRTKPCRQRELLAMHRESAPLGMATLAASAQQLDTPLVAAGGGVLAAGLYAVAGRLLGPLGFLASSLGLVGAPWLARAKRDPAALRGEEMRIIRVAGVISLAPLVAAAAGPALIPLVLGSDYADSGTVFAVLAIGSVFSTANQPLAIIAINRKYQRSVAVAIAIGVGTGLLSTYVLTMTGGPVWAAVGFTVSQLYILAHLSWTVRRIWTNSDENSRSTP